MLPVYSVRDLPGSYRRAASRSSPPSPRPSPVASETRFQRDGERGQAERGAKFNPYHDEQGRFTTGDGAGGGADPFADTLLEIVVGQGDEDEEGEDGGVISDANPDDFGRPGTVLAQNADGGPPQVPGRRPGSSRERTSVVKEIGRWLKKHGGVIGTVLVEALSWAWDYKEEIHSYLDEPKSLQELQDAVSQPPRKGYQNHQIAEQEAARRDGYSGEMIDGRDNVVRIPTLRHYEISGWYGRRNGDFGWKSPREHLRGKPWSERVRIGHEALVKNGVMKP